MGQFVDRVTPTYVSIGSPWDAIEERIDEVTAYARDWANTLADTIEDLQGQVEQYEPDFEDVDDNIPEISSPVFPERPDISVDLNDEWPDTTIPEPSLKDVDVDLTINEPTAPGDIDPDFNYTPGVYQSCLAGELCSKIKDELVNGGNGLSDLVYGLIIDRNREARRQAGDRALRMAVNTVGARGFNLPGGMAAAVSMEAQKEIHAKDIDAVNAVTIKDFEIADANSRFIKDLSLKVEQYYRQAFDSEETRLFEIARETKNTIIAIYEQNVKKYLAMWDGEKAKLEAKKAQVDAIISENEGQIKVFVGRADVLKSKIMAISEENKSKTEVAKAQASVYESEVRAISVEYDALIKEVDAALRKYQTQIQAVVSREDLKLKGFTSAAELTAQISTSIAQIAAQSVASALGAINTSMSYGYHGSTSASASTSVSNSLSEGHSYEES